MIKDFQTYTFNNGEEETNLYFFHTDHLGSTNYLTDKDGVVQQSIVYQPNISSSIIINDLRR